MQDHRKLRVWRHAHELALAVRQATKGFPSTGYAWRFTSLPETVRLLADSYEHDFEQGAGGGTFQFEDPPPPVEGDPYPRTFMLEVERDAEARVDHLALVKDRPWEQQETTDNFELLLSIKPPLHGVQVKPADLALDSPGGLTA